MGKHNFRVSVNLVLKKDDTVLLMRRFNTGWNDGKYALMGGHLEDGENPLDAVLRESQEELGIKINKKDIECLLTMAVNPDHIYLYFGCSRFKGKVENKELDQCDDIQFFNINKLPDNIIDADKLALQTIANDKDTKFVTFGW